MNRLWWLMPAILLGGLWAGSAWADEEPAKQGRGVDQRRDGGGPPPRDAESGRRPPGPADARRPGPPANDDFDNPGPPDQQGPRRQDRRSPPGPPRDDDGERRDGDRPRPPGPPPGEDGRGPGGPQGPGRPGVDQPPPPRWPRQDLEALRDSDPEMFKLMKEDMDLDRQSRDLVLQYRKATSDQRDKIKAMVVETVNKHFDVRQQRRALELKRLEEELQRLRDSVEHRTRARKELVEKRVSELLGKDDQAGF